MWSEAEALSEYAVVPELFIYSFKASVAQADWLLPNDSYDFAPSPCFWFLDLVAHVS
jgi:hypothetical protein